MTFFKPNIKNFNHNINYFNLFILLYLILNLSNIINQDFKASYPVKGSDYNMYYKTIINLTTLGIHSYDDYDIKKSHYRDPLYPYIISFFIKKTIKDTAELSKCHFEEKFLIKIFARKV